MQKTCNTSKAGPTMCISFANERKTQIEWVATIKHRTQKWVNANNNPPKGSYYHWLDSDEMIMRSLCLKAFENI